jgi:hypothetical protein
MISERAVILASKLDKGIQKTLEFFSGFQPDDWDKLIYPDPPWTLRSILVHLLSAEAELLRLAQNVTEGGSGVPEGFDIHAFNQAAQTGLSPTSSTGADRPSELLQALSSARQQTIAWAAGLTQEQLDRIGRHPALGEISVEAMLNAIWGHHLLHIREIRSQISSNNP